MNTETLLKVLLKAGVITENEVCQGDPDSYDIDLTRFTEYGKFVINGALVEEGVKCPHCGKVDHEDTGGCYAAATE